ncbi:MAG: damage-inducible protein DinB [Chitinophagaceae bacterium]|nr:damage-inducible protein DinB [Chitinophagaceae bacterium]
MLSLVTVIMLVSTAQSQLADSLKAYLIKDWERAKLYTKEYLDAMPKDKYDFRAQDSVRTFAQQMLHLAQATVGLSANATGKQRWTGQLEARQTAQSADSVVYYVMASYDFAIEGIKSMNTSQFLERAGTGRFQETKLGWLLKAFEHQTHHRGQATIYIRLLGIKPPNEKLF